MLGEDGGLQLVIDLLATTDSFYILIHHGVVYNVLVAGLKLSCHMKQNYDRLG